MNTNGQLIELALRLSEKWTAPVFPCNALKKPLTPNGFHGATSDPETITKLFGRRDAVLVGLPTGATSRISVIDLDVAKDGTGSGLDWFVKNKHRLPATYAVRTPSGGMHFYYSHVEGVRCSQSQIADRVDIRGTGGYIICGGGQYSVIKDRELADFPGWVREILSRSKISAQVTEGHSGESDFRKPGCWHNSVRDKVASLVARGVSKQQILEIAPAWKLGGYSLETTLYEVEVFIDSAIRKGFAPQYPDLGASFKTSDSIRPLFTRGPLFESDGRDKDTAKPEYTFLSAPELTSLPQPKWLIKGLLPSSGIATIFGPSKAGKTFLALDLLACIARGESFYGRRVKRSCVVYVSLEGSVGLANRIRAYEQHHDVQLPRDRFRIVLDRIQLFRSDITRFANSINAENLDEGVIVIDTLAQAATGADENSSVDMGQIISNAQRLQRMTGGLVLLIHHVGKDASRGQRGHSSLLGALDASIEVKNPATGRLWVSDKVKDGAAGGQGNFRLEVIDLGLDEDGDPITSCVAVRDLFGRPIREKPKGKYQSAVADAITRTHKVGDVLTKEALESLAAEAVNGSSRPKSRAKSAIEALVIKEYLRKSADGYEVL